MLPLVTWYFHIELDSIANEQAREQSPGEAVYDSVGESITAYPFPREIERFAMTLPHCYQRYRG